MARTKEFDPDTAVDAAMLLFWEKGYEATSLADLLARLGIGRASFYDTFGSKHALYLRALQRYSAGGQGRTPLELLARPGPAIDAVRALVEAYAEVPQPGVPPGCFVVNAAVECADTDQEVVGLITAERHGLRAALTATLLRARAEGDLPADAEPKALAGYLIAVLNGIQVLQRSGAERAMIDDAARLALRSLR